MENLAVVILAAGLGKRMRSDLPKVLHETTEKSLIEHVLETAASLAPQRIVVVTGHRKEMVEEKIRSVSAFSSAFSSVKFAFQKSQLGTGDAVRSALSELKGFSGTVIILYGDVPLLRAETLKALIDKKSREGSPLALISEIRSIPGSLGRVVRNGDNHSIAKVVEEKDCNPSQLALREVNAGIYAIDMNILPDAIGSIAASNAQNEYYLTDIVSHVVSTGRPVTTLVMNESEEFLGVNDLSDLVRVNSALNSRRVMKCIRDGVKVLDPGALYLDSSVIIEPDVTIGPSVELRGKTSIGSGTLLEGSAFINNTTIGKNCTIKLGIRAEGAAIGDGASVGPFAHLRSGTVLESDVKIGNFVETKKAHLSKGAKASHLTYLGDCKVGKDANIGAGTITCNYDGYNKFETIIEEGAFIGSNTSLVAPVRIGKGAVVGAGSAISKDVPPDALAVTRAPQVEKEGWAKRKREKSSKK